MHAAVNASRESCMTCIIILVGGRLLTPHCSTGRQLSTFWNKMMEETGRDRTGSNISSSSSSREEKEKDERVDAAMSQVHVAVDVVVSGLQYLPLCIGRRQQQRRTSR